MTTASKPCYRYQLIKWADGMPCTLIDDQGTGTMIVETNGDITTEPTEGLRHTDGSPLGEFFGSEAETGDAKPLRSPEGFLFDIYTGEDGTPVVHIDTAAMPDNNSGTICRVYLNDGILYENPTPPDCQPEHGFNSREIEEQAAFGRAVLAILDESEDWGSDELQEIGERATWGNLGHTNSAGFFRIGPAPVEKPDERC